VADITTLQIKSGDISNIVVSEGDITSLSGVPATITIESDLELSDAAPSDVARESNPGVLEIASRADHIHSIANSLLDGGNY
jgi:hypothetical protein